ncbi:orotidine 5'-phosphate decarboxylase [Candidatus Kaiserbacteria bacterium RIFCSPHIGHO2_12_FULL_53_13]|uniref:Orotidine 5'-phosphate decarboxylase n=1 Tax=Candidatus Kaiserbacteria bacterium RIFCSPHIGHO2_12_FULL_53_13 TaxID=1798502 RepID=A0A1F6EA87_9BACT|nr:MAG: orotidine 5'-phosphate decarboxylase [Candidatus Kaiserbacteria bacterium RIFCSPHIGHO2_12_FULL_53_13]OGG74509.1 MAG: orotidine 5'-phosphate decarboxylase [Candidatus Kaiserbacteria bacterium RIFCSPLOWO2_01_FULL_52_36]
MVARNFRELLESRWKLGNFLCVGLDSELERIPESARKATVRETILSFNKEIIDATKDLVCAFKPNPAFYEALGGEGWAALRETIDYIREVAPDVPIILDAKRGDIGNTNAAYAESAFDFLGVDAITVQPYLGSEPLEPFFRRAEKGIIVLCHTSNPGAGEIQGILVEGVPLYKVIAQLAASKWNENGNCCVMVGATYPEELQDVREIVGDMPILTAGIGAQNGDLEKTMKAGLDKNKKGLIVNASRSVIFASNGKDFAEAARKKATALDSEMRKVL